MYATQANLEARFGNEVLAQLTDRVNGTAIDVLVVTRAIADAEAEIDAYLAGRYVLPLASVPTLLERLACDLAYYYLCGDRVTEQVRARYEDVQRTLKAIATGQVTLGVAGVAAPTSDSGGVASRAPDRVFGSDTLAGY